MRKISTTEVLRALCNEIPLTKNDHVPITKARFKSAMLSSELFTSKTSINLRWEQLYNKIELIEQRGIIRSTKMQFIILDPIAIETAFKTDDEELPFNWEGTHTYTHTDVKEESQ